MTFSTISKNNTEIRESPIIWIDGIDSAISIQVDGTGTIDTTSMLLYENGNDVSSTKLTGSITVSGRVITTKTFSNLVGGNVYKFYVKFNDADDEQIREGTIYCMKLGVNPAQVYPSATDRLKLDDSPITMYSNQSKTFSFSVMGRGQIASVTMYIYKGTADMSSTLLSGSASVTDRTITLQTISGLTGGSEYMVYVFFTDGGKETCRYFHIICPKFGR